MDNLMPIEINHIPASKPEYLITGRQQGKTSESIERLRDNPGGIMLCASSQERRRLEEENPDLVGRIIHKEEEIRGRQVSYLIVDEGDLNTTHVAGVPVDFVTISLTSPTISEPKTFFDTIADYIPTSTTTHEGLSWGNVVQQYYHVPTEEQAIDNTPIDYALEDIADEEDF